MIISPKYIFKKGIVKDALKENVQPNGIDIRTEDKIVLPPKSFENIWCIESVYVPHNMVGRLNIRSTYSRMGVFCTSGLWDSDFYGKLGCSIYNLSNEVIIIPKGERIAQIFFLEADSAGSYNGQYQGDGLPNGQKQLSQVLQKVPEEEKCEHNKTPGNCGICAEGDPTQFHLRESEGPYVK